MKSKILFWILFSIGIFTFFFFLQFTLVKETNRNSHYIELPTELQEEIILETKNLSDLKIINYCVEKTAQILKYSSQESTNIILPISKAHCVTYAKVCATMCNTAFKAHGIPSKAHCVVGYVETSGINLCKFLYNLFNSTYLINHDFVEIRTSDTIIYVDPCAYDLIGMDLKQINAAY